MTREQSRANTRERLLLAARRVFARSGCTRLNFMDVWSMNSIWKS